MVSGDVSFLNKKNKERKKTPKDWTKEKDSNSNKEAGDHPNQVVWKSRSGHYVIADDSNGSESLTIGHRSGSQFQFRPDGGVHVTTHNGKYEVIFGEDRVVISGARDITVKGDASMRVYGDYNTTVHGDYNLAIMGDYNVTSKNHNRLIRGNIDTVAKNETKKFEGSSSGTYLGGYARSAESSVSVISRGETSYFGAGGKVAIEKAGEEEDGEITVRNKKGKTVNQNDDGAHQLKVTDGGKDYSHTIQNGSSSIDADGDLIAKNQGAQHYQSEKDYGVTAQGGAKFKTQGKVQFDAQQDFQVKSMAKAQIRGESAASLDSSGSTHVGSDSGLVSIRGTGGGVALDGQQVSLNSGLSQIFQEITGMQFELPGILDKIPMPDMSSAGAQSTQEEPPAKDWTSRLA